MIEVEDKIQGEQPVASRTLPWFRLLSAVLLVGAGTGAAMAVYHLMDRFLNAYKPGQVLEVFHSGIESRRRGAFSVSELHQLEEQKQTFAVVAAYSPVPLTVDGPAGQKHVDSDFVTSNYFEALPSRFLLGSRFQCSAAPKTKACHEVILGAKLWRESFGSDPHIIGRSLLVENELFTVRGVVETESGAIELRRDPELWIPISAEPQVLNFDWTADDSTVRWLFPLLQLRPQVTIQIAQESLRRILPNSREQGQEDEAPLILTPGQANLSRAFRIRGRVVELFGSYLPPAFWVFVLLWTWGMNRWAADRLVGRVPPFLFLFLIVAELLMAFVVHAVVRRVMLSFLWLFGSPTEALQSPLQLKVYALFALAIATAAALAFVPNWLRRSHQRASADSTFLTNAWVVLLGRYRYALLSGALAILLAGFASNGLCVSDFWQHAAVVRELATHPVHPVNPILASPAPHVGYSPYGLLLGNLSRLTGLSAVDVLRICGVLNFLLLALTLRLFVRQAFPSPHTDFYILLFTVFLWGFFPWMFGGFLHLNYLVQGAPYPSTFATALVFLAWYFCVEAVKPGHDWLWLPVTVLISCVLLDHPITAISLCVGLFAITLDFGRSWTALVRLGFAYAAGFLLAGAWPYYSVAALWFGKSSRYDSATSDLFPGLPAVVLMTFPALLGLPILIRRLRKNRFDFVCVAFFCLLLIYSVGYLTGRFVFGRIVPFIILMLQFAIADWMAHTEEDPARLRVKRNRWIRDTVVAATAVGVLMMLPGLISTLPIYQNSYGEYRFLSRYVPQYATVLSDFDSCLKIPVFGGKVAGYAPEHVLFFVDVNERVAAVKHFFASSSDAARAQALADYHVDFVLLNEQKTENWPVILRSLTAQQASVVYGDGDMLLVAIHQAPKKGVSGEGIARLMPRSN